MELCVKLDWDIDLSKYAEPLINRPSEWGPKSNSIRRDLLLSIVPELKQLNDILNTKDLRIAYSSVMSIQPGTYGILHVDGFLPEETHDLKFNIPIVNGTGMITRWYDLTGLPYDRIDWNFDRTNLSEADLWFLSNAELLVEHHCVNSMVLDGPYLFNSGYPHNVDGRHATDTRTILGMNFERISTETFLKWCDRHIIIDAIAELKLIHPK
jgi:hypothetical protein